MIIINLFGGPGSGKSTTALALTYCLKMSGLKAEYVSEWVKDLVYKKDHLELSDQYNIFAQQNNKLKVLSELDFVVTDSPLVFAAIYPNVHYPLSQLDESKREQMQRDFTNVVVNQFKSYEGVNIFLNRLHDYQTHGRTQTPEQAKEVEGQIISFLETFELPFYRVDTDTNCVKNICQIIESVSQKNAISNQISLLSALGQRVNVRKI